MTVTERPASAASVVAPAKKLKGSLGVTAIVLMVVAAASPLTNVGGVVPLGILLGNGVGFPSLYVISAAVLLLFAVGFTAMTRHVPKPGAFFSYVTYGLGRRLGIVAAWLAILAYSTIQVAVHGYIGSVLSTRVAALTGVDLPWYLYALVIVAIIGFLGYRHIDLSSKVLGLFLCAEVGIVVALIIAVLVTGGDAGLSLEPLYPSNVVSGSPGVGLMFAFAAFIGFEATTVFRDEARDPDRTIPRATYASLIGVGVFYTVAGWAVIMAWGPEKVMEVAAADPGAMVLTTMGKYLGPFGEIASSVLLITAMFAAILSFHNVITRYQLAMSNVGVLPARLASVHGRHRSPHASSVAQTITAAVLIVLFAALGLDGVLQVFTWFAGVGTIAIVILMALTSISVIVFFARTRKDSRAWNTKLAPALGLLGLIAVGVVILIYFPLLVGDVDASGNPVFGLISAVMLGLVVATIAFGFIQAAILKTRRPAVYAAISAGFTEVEVSAVDHEVAELHDDSKQD